MDYDQSDPKDIERYARRLVGKRLRDMLPAEQLIGAKVGKGQMGTVIENLYFGIHPGNVPAPDFEEAKVELKTFPLKRLKKGGLVAKERISLGMIDYDEVGKETWADSKFLRKNALLLLMAYLHEADPSFTCLDYLFKFATLWDFPPEDMKIIRDDWERIAAKVRAGKAHELSEGDTMYLGAVTKSADSSVRTSQPRGPDAKPRAFSLKQQYVNVIVRQMLGEKPEEFEEAVKDPSAYQPGETFEDLVIRKFKPFIGKTSVEMEQALKVELNPKAKGYPATLARAVLGVKGKIEEFEKAGIVMKTIRLEKNGAPKESMSFPAFDYSEIIKETWEESTLREQLSRRFFFVVFNRSKGGDLTLKKVMFWTMPEPILDGEVQKVWEETVRRIKAGKAGELPGQSENAVAHVRPHGKNAADTLPAPGGLNVVKKCFWLDRKFIASQLGG